MSQRQFHVLVIVAALVLCACATPNDRGATVEVTPPEISAKQKARSDAIALERAENCKEVVRAVSDIDAESYLGGPYEAFRDRLAIARSIDIVAAIEPLSPRSADGWQPARSRYPITSGLGPQWLGPWQYTAEFDGRRYFAEGKQLMVAPTDGSVEARAIWTGRKQLEGTWKYAKNDHLVLMEVGSHYDKQHSEWWNSYRSRIDVLRLNDQEHASHVTHVETPGRIQWTDIRDDHLIIAVQSPINSQFRDVDAPEQPGLTYERRAELRRSWLDEYWTKHAAEYRHVTLPPSRTTRRGQDETAQLGCRNVYLPGPASPPLVPRLGASLLTFHVIDLDSGRRVATQALLGGDWKLVSRGKSLLASWSSNPFVSDTDETFLHLFDLQKPAEGLSYVARGAIDDLLIGQLSLHALSEEAFLFGMHRHRSDVEDRWHAPKHTVLRSIARSGDYLVSVDDEAIRAPSSYFERTYAVGFEHGLALALPRRGHELAVADARNLDKLERLGVIADAGLVRFARALSDQRWFVVASAAKPNSGMLHISLYGRDAKTPHIRIARARCSLELNRGQDGRGPSFDPKTGRLRLPHYEEGATTLHITDGAIVHDGGLAVCEFD
jgi:hypothetical protein